MEHELLHTHRQPPPSALKLVRESLKLFQTRYLSYLRLVIVPLAFNLLILIFYGPSLPEIIQTYTQSGLTGATVVFWIHISSLIFYVLLGLATVKLFGEPANLPLKTVLQKALHVLPKYMATIALQSVIILGGLSFFVVPGVLWWSWFYFAPLVTALHGSGVLDSLTESYYSVRGRFWLLAARVAFINIVVSLLGVLGYIIGAILGLTKLGSSGGYIIENSIFYLATWPLTICYGVTLFRHFLPTPEETNTKNHKIIKDIIAVALLGVGLIAWLAWYLFF